MSRPVCVVTGGSSGIGRCTALEMKKAGYIVYELSRKEAGSDDFVHIKTDVSDEGSVRMAISQVMEQEGRIDVLINNAGFGISGAVEFTETKEAKHQFDVNFFGVVNTNRSVLPIMREAGKGRIINLSSVAAPIPIPFQAFYSASKAAINAYSLALANELRPFGVSVCVVQPGDIKTGFTAAREKFHAGDNVYAGRISRGVDAMEKDEKAGMSPEYVGRFIRRVATAKRVKPIYTVGAKYQLFCILARLMPSSLLNYLVGLLYAK